jgi:hypothetical protein
MNARRLFAIPARLIPDAMNSRFSRCLTMALVLALPASASLAAAKKPAPPAHAAAASGPKQIGKFEDWTAATHTEAGQTVCYAFTRAQSSAPNLPARGAVVLTVTERASGRDAVALEAGLTYPANATVTLQVDQRGLEFYTDKRDAFARDGRAAVAAFDKGSRVISRSPGAKEVTDVFSLKGFTAAYAAIIKACPPR